MSPVDILTDRLSVLLVNMHLYCHHRFNSLLLTITLLSCTLQAETQDKAPRSMEQGSVRREAFRPHVGNVPYGASARLSGTCCVSLTVAFAGPVINHCYLPGLIALTFDDGPSMFTPHVLDLLNRYHARATFFVNGDNFARGHIDDRATSWPDMVRRMHLAGHQIGSHTWSHADLSVADSEERH
jgi:hypothetical protein